MMEKGSQRKEHFIFNLILQSTFINLILIIVAVSLYYFLSCRAHVLSGVLPICEEVDGEWEHANWASSLLIFLPLTLLHFLIINELFCSILLDLGPILFIIFASQQMLKELR
jgi:hypothetical protein